MATLISLLWDASSRLIPPPSKSDHDSQTSWRWKALLVLFGTRFKNLWFGMHATLGRVESVSILTAIPGVLEYISNFTAIPRVLAYISNLEQHQRVLYFSKIWWKTFLFIGKILHPVRCSAADTALLFRFSSGFAQSNPTSTSQTATIG